jgi:hypothetical protein
VFQEAVFPGNTFFFAYVPAITPAVPPGLTRPEINPVIPLSNPVLLLKNNRVEATFNTRSKVAAIKNAGSP